MAKSQSNNGLCVYMNPTYYDPDEQGYGYWYPAICDLSFIQNYGYFCELQLTSPPPTQSPFQCGVGWVYYNLYCYKMYNQELDFYSASSFCLNIGANLVSIQNNDENNFLDAFSGMSSTKMTWIGLQYVSQQWIWTNGTIANYMNWVQNGPYDPYSHPCGFIFLYYSSNNAAYLQWGNDVCSSLYTFICKTPATV
uniref:C-type lectin domain-containing protein n=1 Tax=Acrobeloides nanus TaxID=290746 RepID=A0A914CV39_9BILA